MDEIKIKDEWIKLEQVLKLSNLTQTGGHAKMVIQDGEVLLNGNIELKRGKKVFKGDIVEVKGLGEFKVV